MKSRPVLCAEPTQPDSVCLCLGIKNRKNSGGGQGHSNENSDIYLQLCHFYLLCQKASVLPKPPIARSFNSLPRCVVFPSTPPVSPEQAIKGISCNEGEKRTVRLSPLKQNSIPATGMHGFGGLAELCSLYPGSLACKSSCHLM